MTETLPARTRPTGWDVAPASVLKTPGLIGKRPFIGADGTLLPVLPADLLQKVEKAQEWAESKKLEHQAMMQKRMVDFQQQEMEKRRGEQRKMAIQKMCRVYIGSVPFELDENDMTQLFQQFGPIDVTTMQRDPVTQKHKGFCFIEFKMPEAAELAIKAMNGYKIGTRVIKVSEPNNTQAQIQPMIDFIRNEVKEYPGIYVANLHPEINEVILQTMLAEFGTVESVELMKDGSGQHKGYGYAKFDSLESAKNSSELLNNIDLEGQFLFVGKGLGLQAEYSDTIPTTLNLAAVAAAQAAATAAIAGNTEAAAAPMDEDVAISSAQRMELTQKLAQRTQMSDRVITLRNMVGVEDAEDPELVEEITEEVAKFGAVKGVKIHVQEGEVVILVGFTEASSAQTALSLNGRLFDGKHIVAELISPHLQSLVDFM